MKVYSDIINMIKEKKVVIVGAGMGGKYMLARLRRDEVEPEYIFDNAKELEGKFLEGVKIIKPRKLSEDCLYIICARNPQFSVELNEQLIALGINSEDIVKEKYSARTYEHMSSLEEKDYRNEIDAMYFERFGKLMDWENPQTYNEKLNWEKVYVYDERKTKLVDKYLVREYIKEKIGEEYQTKLYGVWDTVEEIDFENLPNQFVLKMNNGSSRNIVVADKTKIDKEEICNKLNEWREKNFFYTCLERQYKNVIPKIICEEYLEGVANNLYDYDVYCFHGEPKYIWCINGSHKEDCSATFYDLNWERQPFDFGYPLDPQMAPKPKQLDKILELSRVLAKDFEHVRIDWYEYPKSKNGILFSEMTFTTWGGMYPIMPEKYDKLLGDMI